MCFDCALPRGFLWRTLSMLLTTLDSYICCQVSKTNVNDLDASMPRQWALISSSHFSPYQHADTSLLPFHLQKAVWLKFLKLATRNRVFDCIPWHTQLPGFFLWLKQLSCLWAISSISFSFASLCSHPAFQPSLTAHFQDSIRKIQQLLLVPKCPHACLCTDAFIFKQSKCDDWQTFFFSISASILIQFCLHYQNCVFMWRKAMQVQDFRATLI